MKKILSMLLAVCSLASFVTVASAAETPTMKLVAEKITSFEGKYAEFAGDFDWSGYEEEYNADYETYSLKVVATGVEIETYSEKVGKTTYYRGDSILGAQFDIGITTDAAYSDDWQWAMIDALATPVGSPSETGATLAITGTNALYPVNKEVKKITKDDEIVLVEFLVVQDVSKPINFTFDNYILFVGKFNDLSKTPDSDYNYAYDNGTMTTTTATFTLPETTVEPEPEPVLPEVVVGDKMDLAADGAIGAAWDVTIKNFDSTKAYMATFTDVATGEVRRNEGAKAIDVSAFAETTGDLGFAVIMNLTAERNVALTVAIQ